MQDENVNEQGEPTQDAQNLPKAEATDAEKVAPSPVEEQAENVEDAEDNIVELSPTERMKGQVDDLAAKLRTVSKAYTDLQGEMDSFRQRQLQLADVKAQKKAGEVIEAFFEPVQNLKRCLETAGGDADAMKSGLEMVLEQFTARMDKLGLKEVPGVGSRFDPNVHNALALQPVTEKDQDGIVLLVHAAGYAVGSRVIQPAQVVIGKFEEAVAEA